MPFEACHHHEEPTATQEHASTKPHVPLTAAEVFPFGNNTPPEPKLPHGLTQAENERFMQELTEYGFIAPDRTLDAAQKIMLLGIRGAMHAAIREDSMCNNTAAVQHIRTARDYWKQFTELYPHTSTRMGQEIDELVAKLEKQQFDAATK